MNPYFVSRDGHKTTHEPKKPQQTRLVHGSLLNPVEDPIWLKQNETPNSLPLGVSFGSAKGDAQPPIPFPVGVTSAYLLLVLLLPPPQPMLPQAHVQGQHTASLPGASTASEHMSRTAAVAESGSTHTHTPPPWTREAK